MSNGFASAIEISEFRDLASKNVKHAVPNPSFNPQASQHLRPVHYESIWAGSASKLFRLISRDNDYRSRERLHLCVSEGLIAVRTVYLKKFLVFKIVVANRNDCHAASLAVQGYLKSLCSFVLRY
jgi:hypothetical protein